MPQGALSVLQLADLVLVYAALALVLGSLAAAHWLAADGSGWGTRTRRRALSTRRWGLALGAAALCVGPWLQAAAMGEVPLLQAMPTLAVLLRDTHFGHVGLAGLAAWCVVGLAGGRKAGVDGAPRVLVVAGLLVFAWSRSAVSHAAAEGDDSLEVAVDMLHVLATALWVGVVWIGARLALPSIQASMQDRAGASGWLASLSVTATAALAVVLATGAFKVWRVAASGAPLLGSAYGSTLWIKLALVAAAVALGGFNRFRVLPGLLAELHEAAAMGCGPALRQRLLGILRAEAIVLCAVLASAALLASLEPAG